MNKENKMKLLMMKKQQKIGKKVKRVVQNKEKMINMNMKQVIMNHQVKVEVVNSQKRIYNRNNNKNKPNQHKRNNVVKRLYINKFNYLQMILK